MAYVSAGPYKEGSSAVLYVADDGARVVREGGSRSWRNNNPGNIRYTQFSRSHGAIGSAGGFAVFPDFETGRSAVSTLLRGPSYSDLSISSAISRYAPPVENDTANYERLIARLTGLDTSRKLKSLSHDELSLVVSAIQTIEGYSVGRETVMKRVVAVKSDGNRLTRFLIEGDSTFITLAQALLLAAAGAIDAVAVHPASGMPYLRARSDGLSANNFAAMAEPEDA